MCRNIAIFIISSILFLSSCDQNNSDNPIINNNPIPTLESHNPIITTLFTADPAALVHDETVYVYTGHDEQEYGTNGFLMKDWHIFSSKNMVDWKDHGAALSIATFDWAKADAWAGHCVEKAGKFYWYVPMAHKTIGWFGIGVAVSDTPIGPFSDAKGEALITDETPNSIELNIDPSVFVDDDGKAYLYWGGFGFCRMVKLKDNMIELDGNVIDVPGLTGFTEAPWVHKKNGIYYLSYASGFPEKISYATSSSPLGPWKYKDVVNDFVRNSPTNHQAIIEFKNQAYFIYHNGGLYSGGEYRRSVCIDSLFYNSDGTMKQIKQTSIGVGKVL